jgi:O-antigen/teichoic acid export membrane protein
MKTQTAAIEGSAPPPTFGMGGVGRHTLIYGTGVLLSKALAFIMLPVYTRYLTPADYGVMGLIEMTLDVVAILGGAQLVSGIYRFYHKAASAEERDRVIATSFLLLGASYAFVGALAFLFSDRLSTLVFHTAIHGNLIRLAAAGLTVQSLMVVPLAYARVRDRSKLYVGANALKLVIAAGLNVLFLVVLHMGVEGVFLSTVITRVVVGGGLAVWVIRDVGFHFSRDTTRGLLRYGLPLVVTNIATFIATFGDRYFLEAAAGNTQVGLYNLAYQFGFLLAVIGFLPFDQVWGPKRFEIAKRPDRDELLAKGFLYASLSLLTVGVGIALFVDDVLRVMTDPAYHGAAKLVPIILVAYVLQSWAKIQDIGILVRERTEFITAADWIAAGIAVLGYWLLVPRWLGLGAAVATVVAFAFRYGLTYWFSQRLLRVEYRWRPVLVSSALAVGFGVTGTFLSIGSLWVSLSVRSLLFGAFLVAIWKLEILSDEERRSFKTSLATLRSSAFVGIKSLVTRRSPAAEAG